MALEQSLLVSSRGKLKENRVTELTLFGAVKFQLLDFETFFSYK